MRRTLIRLILCVTALPFLACAQGQGGEGKARIACDEPEYSFGERDSLAVVEHTFVIKNVGDAPLLIDRVKPACGCTAVTLGKKTVEPGGETSIKAKLSLRGRRGKQRKSIRVQSNDPVEPNYFLWLTGTVTVDLALQPAYANFGQVAKNAQVSREVHLTGREAGNVTITGVRCEGEGFAAELLTNDAGKGTGVRVRTLPPLKDGYARATAVVSTDSPRFPELRLALVAIVEPPVMVLPRQLVLRKRQTTAVDRAILVRPGGVKNFKVLGVQTPSDAIKAEVSVATSAAGGYRIDLRNIPADPALKGKSIVIKTDVAEMPEVRVPILILP